MEQDKKPIDIGQVVMLILAAFLIDLLDLVNLLLDLIGIGIIFSIISGVFKFVLFKFWFWALGVKGLIPLATQAVGAIVEAIPAIDALPVTTLTVIAVIIMANSGLAKLAQGIPGAKSIPVK